MNQIESYQAQLPETLEEVGEFAILKEGQYKYMLEAAKALKKAGVAKEVCDQKMKEAQELSFIAVAAGQRFGELLLDLPKATPNNNPFHENSDRDNFVKSKTEVTANMGLNPKQVSQYQQMAQNPEAVQAAIQKAIENGDVVSRNQVMKEIRSAKAELERQLAEKDRKISELENRKPEIKIERVEVIPNDYEELKKDAKTAWDEQQRVATELRETKEKLRSYEEQEGENEIQTRLEKDADYFSVLTTDFLRKVGSFVWVSDRIELLPNEKRKNLIKSIINLDGWCQNMLRNIGGDLVEK